MTAPAVRRGEVWWADLPADKKRPVLVLTRDPMGAVLRSVICVPITSNGRGISTEVPLGRQAGLKHKSFANFDNTLLLERSCFIRRLGQVSSETMTAACTALEMAIGCW